MVVGDVARYKHAAVCGAMIRDLRKERRFSLKELAKKSGLPYQYLSRIERGEVNTPLETLAIIAQALDVPVRRFFPSDKAVSSAQVTALLEDCSPPMLYALYKLLMTWKREAMKT